MRRHRRLRRNGIKKQRRIITLSLIGATFLLASAYAAFNTGLNINAKGNLVEKITANVLIANALDPSSTIDGLYTDSSEGITRYIYKGADPNNYIYIKENGTNVKYRIYSIESDGSMKVIRDEAITSMNFDVSDATRRKTGYCSSYDYCNAWVAKSYFTNGYFTGAVKGLNGNSGDSSIKEYIDGTYASMIDTTKAVSKVWNISGTTNDRDTLANAIADEKKSTRSGKIALLTASEFVRANSNTASCGTLALLSSNYSTCKSTNYLVKSFDWWLLSPSSSSHNYVLFVRSDSNVSSNPTYNSNGVRPVLYLCSGLTYKGSGTNSKPYEIKGGSCSGGSSGGGSATPTVINGRTIDQTFVPQYYDTTYNPRGVWVGNNATTSAATSTTVSSWTQDPTTLGSIYYLGHDVDSTTGTVTANYACFVMDDTQYCMRGGGRYGIGIGDYFPQNKVLLETLWDEGKIECSIFSNYEVVCSGGGLGYLSVTSYGATAGISSTYNGGVGSNGRSSIRLQSN